MRPAAAARHATADACVWRSVAAPALPGGLEAASAVPAMLPVSQQRGVSGAVLRWSDATGLETLPAGEYIADLESEVRRLRDTVAAMQRAGEGRNPLLEDLKAMEPSNLSELTTRAVRSSSAALAQGEDPADLTPRCACARISGR